MIPFFEVHVWPTDGRILMINQPSYSQDPAVTFLTVGVPEGSPVYLRDTTIIVAMALAASGDPAGDQIERAELIEHSEDGSMRQLDVKSLATVAILRKAVQ